MSCSNGFANQQRVHVLTFHIAFSVTFLSLMNIYQLSVHFFFFNGLRFYFDATSSSELDTSTSFTMRYCFSPCALVSLFRIDLTMMIHPHVRYFTHNEPHNCNHINQNISHCRQLFDSIIIYFLMLTTARLCAF